MNKDQFIFVKYDGVLYAMYRCAPIFEFWNLQADAYFKHLEESDCLMEHYKLAEDILSRMTPEQAERFRNIADNKVYGTIKYEDFFQEQSKFIIYE